jgi:hypothetical protein
VVSLYNFRDEPHTLVAHPWRLPAGTVEVRVSPQGGKPTSRRIEISERGHPVEVELPPRKLTELELSSVSAAERPERLADAAIAARDITFGAPRVMDESLKVKKTGAQRPEPGQTTTVYALVHNIGSEPIEGMTVRFFALHDGTRQALGEVELGRLAPPADLLPSTAVAEIPWDVPAELPGTVRVELHCGDEQITVRNDAAEKRLQ